MVRAPSFNAVKMPSMESSMSPMTKQLNRVTWCEVPAPARMRPPGRKRKSRSSEWKRGDHSCGRLSTEATAPATRLQVSSTLASARPELSRRAYLLFQIKRETSLLKGSGMPPIP